MLIPYIYATFYIFYYLEAF